MDNEEDKKDCEKHIRQIVNGWEQRRQMAAVQLICYIIHMIYVMELDYSSNYIDRKIMSTTRKIENIRKELMDQINTNDKCRDVIRMGPFAFAKLCQLLRDTNRLRDYKNSIVEEQLAKFLYMLSLNARNHAVCFFFHRSTETTSRHFHEILRAIISLEALFLKQPNGNEVPSQIKNSHRFFPFFKDCVGAIDGTHIRVKVSREMTQRYGGRKDYPTQNILAACDFDMKFAYVLPGWEGTASDSRIIKNALIREDKLVIREGKYYLVDAGYMLCGRLITLYRGVHYHLKEYSTRGPQNMQELFNHRHASLHNVIERSFGVLKKRFPIISSATEPHYSVSTITEN